jgi:hypothetical protein
VRCRSRSGSQATRVYLIEIDRAGSRSALGHSADVLDAHAESLGGEGERALPGGAGLTAFVVSLEPRSMRSAVRRATSGMSRGASWNAPVHVQRLERIRRVAQADAGGQERQQRTGGLARFEQATLRQALAAEG